MILDFVVTVLSKGTKLFHFLSLVIKSISDGDGKGHKKVLMRGPKLDKSTIT